MPAIALYTGVLYDAFDAASLSAAEAERAHEVVAVHSALFGLVAAGDPIPAYRLSFDSRLPGTTLKRAWAAPVTTALEQSAGVDRRPAVGRLRRARPAADLGELGLRARARP